MGALFSLFLCIISAVSFLATDIAFSEDTGTNHQTDEIGSSQVEKYKEGIESLEEQNDAGESIPPSIYKLYPESEEFDVFDDEEEASYCS
ncbi:MAG: hypothetical protein V3V59_04830 [Thermodesulfovibrionales bacterium]